MIPDIVNGLFEAVGVFALWLNVKAIFRDKAVAGINPLSVAHWSAWGYWNCFYYANLNQWFSWTAGLCVATMNSLWLIGLWKYK